MCFFFFYIACILEMKKRSDWFTVSTFDSVVIGLHPLAYFYFKSVSLVLNVTRCGDGETITG